MKTWFRVEAVLVLAIAGSAGVAAQPKGQPVFTKEQAEAGLKQYTATCSRCHQADLGGNTEAPALAGVGFIGSWGGQTVQDLFRYAQGMPPEGPRLEVDQYLAIVAFILQQNGAVAGTQPLTADTAVRVDTIANGEKPPSGH